LHSIKKHKNMDAKEAREKAEQYIKNDINGQYANVKEEIKDAVCLRQFKCRHYGILKEEVIEILKQEGFEIIHQAGKPGDQSDTIISW